MSMKELPAALPAIRSLEPSRPYAPLWPAVDPVLAPVEPVFDAVDPVLGPVEPGFEAVEPLVEDPLFAPLLAVVDPVIEPVELGPAPAAPPDMLALTSMKPPAAPALPVVPVAPEVMAVVEAVLPAPEPDTRHPVTTTCWPLVREFIVPVCDEPVADCAAAPAPSATAIIVPNRNCRLMYAPPSG